MQPLLHRAHLTAATTSIGILACILSLSALVFSSAALASDDASGDAIRLQLRWHHQFQFAGYYAAIEKGYYKEAGLEVTLVEGGNGKNVVEEIVAGRAEYGVTNSELLLHRLQGKPLVVMAAIFQHSPLVLLSRSDTGISTPQDLPGKHVKMSRDSREIELQAMLNNEGIDLDSLNLIGDFASYSDYFDPQIDVLAAYSTNQPYYLREKDIAYTLIRPSTYGVDFYGDCLFTSENEKKKNPERVRSFLEASLKGWEYALAHPEEIADLILSRYQSRKSRDHLLYEASEMEKLILPNLVKIGHMNPGRWQHIAETFRRFNLIEDNYSIDGFLYTPELQENLKELKGILKILLFILIVISILAITLLLFNRRLQKEIQKRKETEAALQQKEHMLLNYSKQTEQFSLSAAAMLSIQDEKKLFSEISNAIIKHSDYSRVLISLFKNQPPYRDLIGYAGVSEEIVSKVRKTDLAKDWYNNVFSLGLKIGQFSYYVPANLKHILNQEATIYGDGEEPVDEDRWHPHDNLFVRMNDESGKFLGIISVDDSKSGARPTEETVRPLEIYASLISQIIILKREYNRRTKLEHHLRQSQKMEAIGNLTGGIAHDFNNILGIIIGNAELALLDSPDWNPVSHNVQEIKVASLRAKEIVKQLLTFSKKSDRDLRPVVLEEVIDDGLKLLRSTLPAGIELVVELELEGCIVQADPPLVYQMLLNLFSNAVHAMERHGGGKLVITGVTSSLDDLSPGQQPDLPAGTYAVVSLIDNGIGMSDDQLEHIFDPYYTTKETGKGSGLGLSTVHGIIQSHNGDITVESETGKGSAFTLFFPCVSEADVSYREDTLTKTAETGTILLVDDDTALLEVSTRILGKQGYSVVPLSNPEEALKLFKKSPEQFELVVTDMTMPQINGMELAREILKIRPEIPIFLCTGYSDKIDEITALNEGITRYFTKPVDNDEFINGVREVVCSPG